METITA